MSTDWPDPDLVVKSPGVPAEAAAVLRARGSGVPVWSELELAYAVLPNPFDAITGTNGKTTTTALLGHLFATGGPSGAGPGQHRSGGDLGGRRVGPRRGTGGGGVQLPAGGHPSLPTGRRRVPQPHARPSGPARHHGALPGVQGESLCQPAAPGTWRCSTWPTPRWPAWAPSWPRGRTGRVWRSSPPGGSRRTAAVAVGVAPAKSRPTPGSTRGGW